MRGESGQAMLEYILLLAIVAGFVVIVFRGLDEIALQDSILEPLQKQYAHVYQFGHEKAKGFGESGGPIMHPRIPPSAADGNFRIFINAVPE